MLDTLDQQPPDALLALIKLFEADPNPDKIDLGVGVYRTADGATPVFAAIKAAERKLADTQPTKAYLGPEGDMGFVRALMPHIFGSDDPARNGRIDGMQTPGGTGAVRLAVALAQRAGAKRILMGTPSWPNHAQIMTDLGMEFVTFRHAAEDGGADIAALRQALENAGEGDAVLLHGCCHNPTGIDYTPEQWDEIAALLKASGALPVLDLAYQGLGLGMEDDSYGVRKVIAPCPKRWWPIAATRTSAFIVTASARCTRWARTRTPPPVSCRMAGRWRAPTGRCHLIMVPLRCGWCWRMQS